MLQNIILVVSGVVAGAIAALQLIAPKTATTVDDAVLAKLQSLESLLMSLQGVVPGVVVPPAASAPAAPAAK